MGSAYSVIKTATQMKGLEENYVLTDAEIDEDERLNRVQRASIQYVVEHLFYSARAMAASPRAASSRPFSTKMIWVFLLLRERRDRDGTRETSDTKARAHRGAAYADAPPQVGADPVQQRRRAAGRGAASASEQTRGRALGKLSSPACISAQRARESDSRVASED